MKKGIATVFFTVILFFSMNAAYAASTVSVQVPDFSVVLNETVYDNQHAKYPLLVYDNVTYFPMTYQLTRSLGLVTGWDQKKGLYITQHFEETDVAVDTGGNNKLGAIYKATIVSYPIMVNGWQVDNSKEKYPLLNFRDITYFPLTWQYAHDEFGWNIEWNNETGLCVDNYLQSNGDSYITLTKMDQDMALLQKCVSLYDETENADGSITYHSAGSSYYNYRLDFATNTLRETGKGSEKIPWENNIGEDIQDLVSLKERQLLYQDKVILNNLPEEYTKSATIFATRYAGNSANMLAVKVFYNSEIPAPYTPYVLYVFLEKDGVIQQVKSWNEADYPGSFYETSDGYYACSSSRLVVGRFSNSLHTIIKIDKTSGEEIVLNDLYNQYRSLEAIGIVDNKLYVRATYFGEEEDLANPQYAGKVKPVQDGYYYIDQQMKLHKIHDYIDGEVFLAPNGKLYLYNTRRLWVVDLTDHVRLSLIDQ